MTFHRAIKPVTGELQTLRQMSDQIVSQTPIVRYTAALPEKPIIKSSIYECLKDPKNEAPLGTSALP